LKSSQRILKSTVYLTASRLVGDLVFFAFYAFLSHRFGAAGIGLYSFSLALSSMFLVVADYGLNSYLVREVSRNKQALLQFTGTFLLIKLLFTVLMMILLWGSLPLFQLNEEGIKVLAMIVLSQAMYFFGDFLKSGFAVHERLSDVALPEVLHKIFICIVGVALLKFGLPFTIVLLAFPVGSGIFLFVMIWLFVRNFGVPTLRLDWPFLRGIARGAFPFFMAILIADFHFRIGIILLQTLQGEVATGIFSAPHKLITTLIMGISAFQIALFPALSRLHRESLDQLGVLLRNSIRYLLLFMVPGSLLLALIASPLITLIFGPEFRSSIPVLQLLSLALVIMSLRIIVGTSLGAMDKQGEYVSAHVFAVTIFIGACLWAIPKWSSLGCAVAFLVSEAVLLFVVWYRVSRRVSFTPSLGEIAPPLLAAVCMYFVYDVFPENFWAIKATAVFLVGLATLLITGGLKSSDLMFLKNSIVNKTEPS
jgi:O-antigen/teichoic acid export membrane protein